MVERKHRHLKRNPLMRVVIIGGSGRSGTYLTPRLVEAGYEVVNITRGQAKPYVPHPAWRHVRSVTIDREAAEAAGTFGAQVAALEADIIIDFMCFTLASCQHLVEAVRGRVQHFLHTGTIWVHGWPTTQPTTEDVPRKPFPPYNFSGADVAAYLTTSYGQNKAAIEAYLIDQARRGDFPATVLHPGHIVGPGHRPVNPQGNHNAAVLHKLATGQAVPIANLGLETVHHVHGDDVAQAFMKALERWSISIGEAFHVVSPAALTLRGYANAAAEWFGQMANIDYVPWETFRTQVDERDWMSTWDHIAHSPNASIAKARALLGYEPRYTSLQACYEATMWLAEHDWTGPL
jgi:nucleoside-diphosphate-sugar epimerase